MLAHREPRRFTQDEYLALEERSESRSEYHRGVIYAMVSQQRVLVERHTLVRPGQWVSTWFEAGSVELSSVGLEIRLDRVYRGVEL